ncbi:MAG: hypothetical protein C0594_02175 [Marinilabiliales bacterium]|nr:MAG: hypothetical protein C0594_02175 [Marinilabiliales bacterium]
MKDSRGFLWLSSNKGLTRYNPENGNVKIYDINDGLQSYEFNGKSCYKSKRGEMFFGGIRGLNYFFPDSIKDNQYKPPVVITDFSISNQSVPVNEKFNGRVILSKPIYNSEEIELTHEDNVVTFEFSSLDFADPSKNQYEYKMEGFDKDWNEIGNRRYTSYTNLPHGEYVFMVRGSNCDGVWNTEGTSLRVVVLPPWWRTHFFYISVTLAFILIVLGYIRFRVHRLKRDKEILEVEVARRTDEIEERKEELSAQAQHLEMVNKRLEELSVVARETANAITIFDNTGKIEYRNNAFMKLYGEYLKEPVLKEGHSLSELDKKYKIHSYFDDCLREKKPITFTSRRKLEDKSDHWIQTTLTPVFDELGKVEKLVSIDTDITEIKSAEKKILEQAEELEMLSLVASKTDNAVIIADQCGEIEWVNEGFVNITGYTFEQYKKERETNFYNAITVPEVRETLKENIDNKKSTSYYSQLTTRTGNTIWLQSTINPLFDKDGELIKLIAIESNINKLKKAEEEIKRKNRQITDSINYAQKIQNSILPSDQEFKRVFSDYFILFKPRDIVSGDFYWLTELGDKIIVACGDSTGHGVPGGFMSMMGNALLNEIVLEKGIYSASDVLKQLNLSIRSALKQSLEGEQEDGMDISICCIDKGTKMLDVAAANQTIYYRTKEGFLQEYEGDIFSVGGMLLSKPEVKFGSKQLPLSDISAVYMCSDGYQDQFGGEHNQKFMSARLKELISSVMDKTMTEQYASIEATFEIWKKDQKQIDDILVMGLKF